MATCPNCRGNVSPHRPRWEFECPHCRAQLRANGWLTFLLDIPLSLVAGWVALELSSSYIVGALVAVLVGYLIVALTFRPMVVGTPSESTRPNA